MTSPAPEIASIVTVSPDRTVMTGGRAASKKPQWQVSGPDRSRWCWLTVSSEFAQGLPQGWGGIFAAHQPSALKGGHEALGDLQYVAAIDVMEGLADQEAVAADL